MCSTFLIFLTLTALLLHIAEAQRRCTGTISGGTIQQGVVVNGDSCILQGVTVTGSVEVRNQGTLTTRGATQIFGSVEATNSGDVRILGRTTVSGSVLFSASQGSTVTIGPNAVITSLGLENSGTAVVRGTSGDVRSKASEVVNINGGTILSGGLLVEQGMGNVILCGASVTGGISMTETTGDLRAVESTSCEKSVITGSIEVEKGDGDVRLTGSMLSGGDLGVMEQTGKVIVTKATVGDIAIGGISGSISLTEVETESDAEIKENGGSVTIKDCMFQGDVSIELNKAVTVRGSSFGLESVSLKGNTGPIIFTGNRDLSVSFEENRDVLIRGNTIIEASVTSNRAGVSIINNRFDVLSCADNRPRPTGSGNNVRLLADGQCRNF